MKTDALWRGRGRRGGGQWQDRLSGQVCRRPARRRRPWRDVAVARQGRRCGAVLLRHGSVQHVFGLRYDLAGGGHTDAQFGFAVVWRVVATRRDGLAQTRRRRTRAEASRCRYAAHPEGLSPPGQLCCRGVPATGRAAGGLGMDLGVVPHLVCAAATAAARRRCRRARQGPGGAACIRPPVRRGDLFHGSRKSDRSATLQCPDTVGRGHAGRCRWHHRVAQPQVGEQQQQRKRVRRHPLICQATLRCAALTDARESG